MNEKEAALSETKLPEWQQNSQIVFAGEQLTVKSFSEQQKDWVGVVKLYDFCHYETVNIDKDCLHSCKNVFMYSAQHAQIDNYNQTLKYIIED